MSLDNKGAIADWLNLGSYWVAQSEMDPTTLQMTQSAIGELLVPLSRLSREQRTSHMLGYMTETRSLQMTLSAIEQLRSLYPTVSRRQRPPASLNPMPGKDNPLVVI